jgi:Cft2 family RNA processing exonuclease
MFTLLPLGGAGEIGASCFYLNISGTGIILDCGMHPQKSGLESLPAFELIKDIPVDFAFISHAHQDHLSALPFLIQRHPYIRIFTTPQTRALAELTLHDSISIWKQQVNEESLKVYSHEEIDLLIQSFEYKQYNEEFTLRGYNHKSSVPLKIIFYDAGHILGSAGIHIEHEGEIIFYTGVINLKPQELMRKGVLPGNRVSSLVGEAA